MKPTTAYAIAASLTMIAACTAPQAAPSNPEPVTTESSPDISGEWKVEDIASTGIIDFSHVTLMFDADGRLSGNSSCNRYTSTYTTQAHNLTLTPITTTRMACPPALMNQERNFLDVLNAAETFRITDTAALIITAADGKTITARPLSETITTDD